MGVIRFLKEWTLPVAIATGTICYLIFYYVPQLDHVGNVLSPVFDVLFPITVFLTLFITFCKVDFHQMRPHRWHAGVLIAQLLLIAANIGIIFYVEADVEQKILWEAVLTCIIGPAASASPVVVGKLGGNISTMTTYVMISSLASAILIPFVFPLLENTVHVEFIDAFLIILEKVSMVLLLPLVLGWIMQHYVKGLCARIAAMPNLSFYCWAVSLAITTGITVKNIVHSEASLTLLLMIALLTFILCFVQFFIGRGIGKYLGEEINSGQALFQKNTALSIWVAYMYLNPVASVGAGCYVLWQNIINSIELVKVKEVKENYQLSIVNYQLIWISR
jgi:Predicted Na+-dependent transporter